MTKNIDIEGLRSIADNYDLFYIDLWGVVHNGITLNEKAIIALKELLKMKKDFVLLTNAPRPIYTVKMILEKMGMEEKIRDHVFTSGEASLNYLKKESEYTMLSKSTKINRNQNLSMTLKNLKLMLLRDLPNC